MAKKQTNLMNIINHKKTDNSGNQVRDPDQERIDRLAGEIRRHRYLYYNQTPEISDAKYDALEDELRKLSPNHPILNEISEGFFHNIDESEICQIFF